MYGDMNSCFKDKKHPWIQELHNQGYIQLIKQASHIAGGLLNKYSNCNRSVCNSLALIFHYTVPSMW